MTSVAPPTAAIVVSGTALAATKPAGIAGKTVTAALVTQGATGRSLRHSPSEPTIWAVYSGVRPGLNARSMPSSQISSSLPTISFFAFGRNALWHGMSDCIST